MGVRHVIIVWLPWTDDTRCTPKGAVCLSGRKLEEAIGPQAGAIMRPVFIQIHPLTGASCLSSASRPDASDIERPAHGGSVRRVDRLQGQRVVLNRLQACYLALGCETSSQKAATRPTRF